MVDLFTDFVRSAIPSYHLFSIPFLLASSFLDGQTTFQLTSLFEAPIRDAVGTLKDIPQALRRTTTNYLGEKVIIRKPFSRDEFKQILDIGGAELINALQLACPERGDMTGW